ncbi:class I SAM-dependent DNA methyltransferase [Pseudonocardia acidicola]|uniref:Methyltransferase domain-containing protein n=1 Tax=Pseudonocardia acidicola TaxID=2724939 RepID=A0ABX1S890_9PSEU|nr:methyltransferase domain-containing protein [Pseudonocardia acidicola]NMH97761.1 methyltransferase domain-containing protein [Pseudonocardia acidicola]
MPQATEIGLAPVLPAYSERADSYDHDTAPYESWRRRLVAALPLRRGDTVLDVGCGTGLCFPLLLDEIGAEGTVIGIDDAPAMLAEARAKADAHGWRNITLIEAPAEHAIIPCIADAALFSAVHDVLQSPAALDNVIGHLRPGAWVVGAGGKFPPAWEVPLTFVVRAVHAPYIRDFTGFDRPWRLLEEYLDDFHVTEVAFGTGYIAVGRARPVTG